MTKGISETAFASQVEDLLKLYGWRWTHFRPAWSSKGYRTPIKGHKGFPDYVAVRPPRLLFIELKDQYSKPSPEQEAWLGDLRECVKTIVGEALTVDRKGKVATLDMTCAVPVFRIPEVYLWRPSQFDEVRRILE